MAEYLAFLDEIERAAGPRVREWLVLMTEIGAAPGTAEAPSH